MAALALVSACARGPLPRPASASLAAAASSSSPPSDDPVARSPLVAPAPPPPFSLTSTDGTGLAIASIRARTSIEDPLALTELVLRFKNPEPRTLEGRFTLTLPSGAALSRFAMRIGDDLQEAEVVEKTKARVTYEDFLHRRRDPALLEQGADNQISVRVFPIGPLEEKEIVVSYSETLDQNRSYRLPLTGLPEVKLLDARVYRGGDLLLERRDTDTRPTDVEIAPARWRRGDGASVGAGTSIVARVHVPESEGEREPLGSVVVLFDTSASRLLDFERQLALLKSFVASLAEDAPLRVACFDQSVRPLFDGKARAFGERELTALRARGALGASDMRRALRWAASTTTRAEVAHRLVLFSDGVGTVAPMSLRASSEALRSLAERGFSRADAIALGGIRDDDALAAIVKGSLPSRGVVLDATADVERIVAKLTTKVGARRSVRVDGAQWTSPAFADVQPGDDVIVHARGVNPKRPVRIAVGESSFELTSKWVEPAFVERANAIAQIHDIEVSQDPSAARDKAIVALSRRHRVVTPLTSMLVLETDEDYQRFHIDRRAKVDVLTVEDGVVATLHAKRPIKLEEIVVAKAAPQAGEVLSIARDEPSAAETNPSSGRVVTGRVVTRPPSVRMGATSVSGRLPPETVQRIFRANFGRFRGCYERARLGHPSLGGRVVLQFVIGRDGAVARARVESSVSGSEELDRCLVRALYALAFPQPEGGTITVTYPLVFSDDDGPDASRTATPLTLPSRPRRASLPVALPFTPPRPPSPWTGRFAVVRAAIADGDADAAFAEARRWREEAPTDVLSFVALGDAAVAKGDVDLAARAYGSVLELWSYRADMRRFAGELLERLGGPGNELAADAFEGAVRDRPDHPSSHRLKAMALLKLGREREAFEAIEAGLARKYPEGRFRGALDVMRTDLGIIGAAWIAKEPSRRDAVVERLSAAGATLAKDQSVRFSLMWETDSSDVDLHVVDGTGDHASYANPRLASGGSLSADVRDGYGPETFTAYGKEGKLAFPYALSVNYYAKGSMGFAMGKLEIMRHDGKGGVRFEDRPYVIMNDRGSIELGSVDAE